MSVKKHKTTGQKPGKPKKFRTTKFLKVSLIYFLLFVALLGMVDYYAMMAYSMWLVVIIALPAALILGYWHVKKGKHDHVDDIAEELL
jgi:hypothetical protein